MTVYFTYFSINSHNNQAKIFNIACYNPRVNNAQKQRQFTLETMENPLHSLIFFLPSNNSLIQEGSTTNDYFVPIIITKI